MPKENKPTSVLKAVPKSTIDLDAVADSDSDAAACPICFGSGLEIVEGKGARPCACRRQNAQSNLLERARLPRRYVECHFHNYKPQNPSQVEAFKLASRLAMEFP